MSRGSRRTKGEKAFFKAQLQKRDEALACEDSDDEYVTHCKILAWVQKINPDDGEGEPPKPRRSRTLTTPRPLSSFFSEAQAAFRPLKRKRNSL